MFFGFIECSEEMESEIFEDCGNFKAPQDGDL